MTGDEVRPGWPDYTNREMVRECVSRRAETRRICDFCDCVQWNTREASWLLNSQIRNHKSQIRSPRRPRVGYSPLANSLVATLNLIRMELRKDPITRSWV